MNSDSTVREQLLQDVAGLLDEEDLQPSLVFFTGDLAFSGKKPEFMWARRFFEQLRDMSAFIDKSLFLIPGNHDWERQSSGISIGSDVSEGAAVAPGKGKSSSAAGGGIRVDTSVSDRSAKTSAEGSTSSVLGYDSGLEKLTLTASLDNYYDAVEGIRRPAVAKRELVYAEKSTLNGISVAVVGLNTAWMGDPEPAVSDIPWQSVRNQAEMAFQRARDAQIRITLLHHPPDYLPKDVAQSLLDNSDFVLHSHAHSVDVMPMVTTSGAVVINGGSDPGNARHPNAYNIVEVDLGKKVVRVYMRRLRGSTWIADPQVSGGVIELELPPRLAQLPLPAEEQVEQELAWRPPFAGYATDKPGGDDQLNITPDVNAFSAVFASKQVDPPLCLGLFGEWGAGKTFFMDKLWDRIELLRARALAAEGSNEQSSYYPHIVQIRFNAWHYIDTNLWASLAHHIFRELAAYITRARDKSDEEKAAEKAQLFQELDTAKNLLAEAEAQQEEAERRLEDAKERLIEARTDQAALSFSLRDVPQVAYQEILSKDPALQDRLDEAVEQIGLSYTVESAEDLGRTLKDIRTFWGQFRASFRRPENRWRWIALFLLVFVAIPLLILALNQVLHAFLDSPQVISIVSFVLAQVAAIFVAARGWLKPVLDAIQKLRDVRAELQKRAQLRIEVELSALEEKEAAARRALTQAQERFDKAQEAVQEIEEIKDERRLMQFIEERVASKQYEKHLGIISVVHNDFRSLSEMLGKGSDPDLPRIDRIILYIDDLDRCPEEKVTDVLQAVHLLLAFRLFIVVVGVDSRWLLRSLERSYPALQKIEAEQTGLSQEEAWVWESTPQNYLEKIFQIPFNLRRMDNTGVERLVDSILQPPSSWSGVEEQTAIKVPAEPPPDQLKEVGTGSEAEKLVPEPEPPPAPPVPTPQEEVEIDLAPPALEIELAEKDFVPELNAMLPTPRAVKRFINTYRLIRARIQSSDLAQFVGDEQDPGEFRVVMVLLGMLTGFPRQASHVFGRFVNEDKNLSWREFIATLEPKDLPGNGPRRFENGVMPSMETAEAEEWRRLYRTLDKLTQTHSLPPTAETYQRWIPRVARFSFRAGRLSGEIIEQ
jgi:hypothetical protein